MILVAEINGIYVIKLGTSLIADVKTNTIRWDVLRNIIGQIARIKEHKNVIVVSSGSIGLGLHELNEKTRPTEMAKKQAAAAIGQNKLMNLYDALFNKMNITIAQVLLTKDGISTEKGYTNAHNTIHTLLEYGIVPIINENDTISTEEIMFGDNDNLAAYVAQISGAEMLILLTDTDGLYDRNPSKFPDAKKYEVIEQITDEICAEADTTNGPCSVGGMCSKVEAAKRALLHNIPVTIASGLDGSSIVKISQGMPCGTLFTPNNKVKDNEQR